MAISLDSNDPGQVASASHIEFETSQPGRKALVFSGIAIPSWNLNDDNNIYHQTITVNLRYPVIAVVNASVSLGLASIGNDDSAFLFATDSDTLCIDNNSQELMLQVDAALSGDPSSLNRFGYQVVVVVTTQSTGISGTIRFSKDVFDASNLTEQQVQELFLVSADTLTVLPPPPGGGFGQNQYNPVAYGQLGGLTWSGDDFSVPYTIAGAPYNVELYGIVQIGPAFKPSGQTTVVTQTGGPSPVGLKVNAPSVSGVDFRVTSYTVK